MIGVTSLTEAKLILEPEHLKISICGEGHIYTIEFTKNSAFALPYYRLILESDDIKCPCPTFRYSADGHEALKTFSSQKFYALIFTLLASVNHLNFIVVRKSTFHYNNNKYQKRHFTRYTNLQWLSFVSKYTGSAPSINSVFEVIKQENGNIELINRKSGLRFYD